jgi:hypothetical protein
MGQAPQLSRILNMITDRAGFTTGASLSFTKNVDSYAAFMHESTSKNAQWKSESKKVAILVTNGFEQVELLQLREALNKGRS